nr:hypothetical protein [Tanacetum cinerariifolium]
MYNDIMVAGSIERPPMLELGEIVKETYGNTNPENKKLINAEAEVVHMILNGIGNDIYSTVMLVLMQRKCGLVLNVYNKEPIEDQPLPADASPTALSPGYIVDFDPEEDEEDPEEDPADYPADEGDNDDNESSDDDDDDDDVEKDEEDEEEEEHLAPANPSIVLIDDLVMDKMELKWQLYELMVKRHEM